MKPRTFSPERDYVALAVEAGVDETMIARLVHRFYADVRADAVLGPIFEARVHDWDAHLGQMCAFWSSIMLRSGRYHGQPMPKHAPLPVAGAHFDHWLALFEISAREVCAKAAGLFVERARRIAQSLEFGVATSRGLLLGPGERLPAPEPQGD